jgi:integrase
LKKAGIYFFPIYYLRHAFASRMTAAGVSPITIAQLLGHASTQTVPRYSVVLDQNRLDAIKKLEALQQSSILNAAASGTIQPTNKETKPKSPTTAQ